MATSASLATDSVATTDRPFGDCPRRGRWPRQVLIIALSASTMPCSWLGDARPVAFGSGCLYLRHLHAASHQRGLAATDSPAARPGSSCPDQQAALPDRRDRAGVVGFCISTGCFPLLSPAEDMGRDTATCPNGAPDAALVSSSLSGIGLNRSSM